MAYGSRASSLPMPMITLLFLIPVLHTILVSPCAQDFISWESQGHSTTKLHGLAASADVMGVGIICWTLRDDKGHRRVIKTQAYYVPTAHVRLLSLQHYFHEQASGCYHPNSQYLYFSQ
jgi:hypothetical protein